MTPEAQRIVIAEACGKQVWYNDCGGGWTKLELPDYLSDLNAMHEAEKILSDQQKSRYVKCIENGVPRPFGGSWSWEMLHATAVQRAEAFLRTLNLWKDSK